MADLSQISKNAKKIKEQLAQQAGVSPKDVNDKNLQEVSAALDGAQKVAQEGGDPTKTDIGELKEIAGVKSGSQEDLSKQRKIAMALTAFLPALVGYSFGGAEGGAVGAAAGGKAVEQFGKQEEKEAESRAALAKEEKERASKKELKEMELASKKEESELRRQDRAFDREMRAQDRATAQIGKQTGLVSDLRKERSSLPVTKQTAETSIAFNKIQKAAQNPSAAGDLSLIFSYIKMLDPGSTVREGEFANAQNAAGIPDRVVNLYNKAIKGERLAEDQRKDFTSQAKNLYLSQIELQKQIDDQYIALAKKQGIDPKDIILNLETSMPDDEKKTAGSGGLQNPALPNAQAAKKPKKVIQNGVEYILNEQTGEYE